MVLGRQYQHDGFYSSAIAAYDTILGDPAAASLHAEALYRLGQTQIMAGDFAAAEGAFSEFMVRFPGDPHADHARVLAGTALEQLGEPERAIEHLTQYVEAHPEVQGYIWVWLGDLYLDTDAAAQAVDAYERAAETASRLALSVYYRELKASALLTSEAYQDVIQEYDRILDVSRIKKYRSKIQYLTGLAHLAAEQPNDAAIRFRNAIDEDQTASYAHSALVKLLELDEEVDEFLRGMVDYYNDAYWPAIEAFGRYLESDPPDKIEQARYYTAASYAEMGISETAMQEYRAFIDEFPESHLIGEAWRALARLTAWQGDTETARNLYAEFATLYPEHPLAPSALLSRAYLAEDAGQLNQAIQDYLALAEDYSIHANAAIALHRAGLALYRLGHYAEAIESWESLITRPTSEQQKREAQFWAGKTLMIQGNVDRAIRYLEQVIKYYPHDYYAQRASTLIWAVGAEAPSVSSEMLGDISADREQAEEWLAGRVDASIVQIRRTIPEELAEHTAVVRARELLEIGLADEAGDELDILREQFKDQPAYLYGLATMFQDWGVARQSILCAARIIALSDAPIEEVPAFLRSLAYPTYFNNLVEMEATERAIDPLLVYSVIRQESLFQSQVSSWASARGLMQVIPDTGEWIAMRLGWHDFVAADLYLPYLSVKFGTYYLQQQLVAFDNDVVSALTAYNAGPGNALRIRSEAMQDDPDLIYALMDIAETRLYLEKVLQNYAIYHLTY